MRKTIRSAFLISTGLLASLLIVACSSFGGRYSAYDGPQSAFGDYLAARYASSESDVNKAAAYFASALKKDPENTDLRHRTMLSAVFSGQVEKAVVQAKPILVDDPDNRLAVLIIASNAISHGKYAEAELVLRDAKLGPLNQVASGLLHGWALHGQGKTDEALLVLGDVAQAPVLGDLALFHRGLILAQTGQTLAADEALGLALGTGVLTSRTAYALALIRMSSGELDEAKVLVAQRLDNNKREAEAIYLAAKLDEASPPVAVFSTINQGAAEALFGPAQVLAERSLYDLAVVYLELALHLDPGHNASKDLLAQLFELQGRADDALAMFAAIDPDSPQYLLAQLNMANVLFRMERKEEALDHLRTLAETTPTLRVKRALANALQIDKQYDAALVLYTEQIEAEADSADWQLYFSRAVCLERTDRWREAVPDFRKSLELNPKQADVLNYLGYTFVNAGENLEEGFALIRQAIELSPRAGYIVDSLGWGYYRLGRFEDAVTELERAVMLEPGEPTINEHLGDTYWQVGRKLEAKYQWQRVLTLEPDEETDLEVIQAKIRQGLPAPEVKKLASDLSSDLTVE